MSHSLFSSNKQCLLHPYYSTFPWRFHQRSCLFTDNSADAWRHELTDLANQIKTSLMPAEEKEQYLRQSRSSRLNTYPPKRSSSSASNFNVDVNDDQNVSKRLLQRRPSQRSQRPQTTKGKPAGEKADQEQTANDENQDPGIWVCAILKILFFRQFPFQLIPILCYILHTDNIFEAQNWLVSANPTGLNQLLTSVHICIHIYIYFDFL